MKYLLILITVMMAGCSVTVNITPKEVVTTERRPITVPSDDLPARTFTPFPPSPVDSFGSDSLKPKKGEISIRSSKMIRRVPTEGATVSSDSTVLNLLNKN